jgi:hypothetical protein
MANGVRFCRGCGARLARDNAAAHCAACARRLAAADGAPPAVPGEFWDTEAMRDALASRQIGQVIRAYRYHPHHGGRPLPQQRVGGWLGLTQAQLSRIENGPAVTDLAKLTAWASTLAVPASRLWFDLPAPDQPPTGDRAAAHGGYAALRSTTAPARASVDAGTSSDAGGGGDDVRRSDFLAAAGGALAGLVTPPLVHGWPGQPPSGPPGLDEELLVQLRAQVEGFRWRDRQEGARRLLPATSRYARRLAHYWQATEERHPLRPALGRLAADACHLVAYQAFDQGDRAQAIEWYRSSAELAARCGAQGMYVFALCGVAYMHARQGRGDLAGSVLDQLAELPLSAADRCYVAAYQAHAHASAGRRDATRRALEAATGHAERTREEPPSMWLGIPDTAWVQRQEAMALAQLGDPQALAALDRLTDATPAIFQRFQVTMQVNYALAHAKTGNIEQTTAHLTAAATRNRHTRSVEKARLMIEARRALPAGTAATRAVRELDELLTDTRAALTPARTSAATR